jgi:ABC-2 type transport system permease protein
VTEAIGPEARAGELAALGAPDAASGAIRPGFALTLRAIFWLFRWELRVQWRSFGRGRTNRSPLFTRPRASSVVVAVMLGVWQLLALGIVYLFNRANLPPLPASVAYAFGSAGLIFLVLGMVSTALDASIQAIYARRDMDLLLSSPFPRQAIILVRLTAIATTVCVGGALLGFPVANACILLGHPDWVVAYVTVPCLGLLATTVGLILAIMLFRLLGARRTRLMAQILSAMLGVTFALTAQIPNLMSVSNSTDLVGINRLAEFLPRADSILWWPVRGAMGDGWLLVMLVVISLGSFTSTTLGLADRFVASAIAAGSIGAGTVRKRRTEVLSFRTEPFAALRRKEIRLLLRDPWLITQIARQLVFLLPLTLVVWRAQAGGISGRWLVLVMTAGYMAGGLTWLTVSAEDAHDLLASAPLAPSAILRAKVQAALLPVALFMSLPVLISAYFSLWLSVCLAICCAGSALGCALLNYIYRAPAKRNLFVRRGGDNMLRSMGELMIGGLWSIAAFMLLAHNIWALAPMALAFLPLYRMARRSTWRGTKLGTGG